MFVLKIIKYLFGYVYFKVYGGFNERFLNLCAKKHINIWNVSCSNNELNAVVVARKYRLLRECAKGSGAKLKVKKRVGFNFILHRYRHRVGVLIGVLILIFILTFSSNFVWAIKIIGNENISSETIYSVLEEVGLSSGILKSEMDIKDLEFKVMEKLEEISWVSIHIKGSVVTVEISERVYALDKIDDKTPCNLVASMDGYICGLETYNGVSKIKVGEAVLEGDLLVSGVVESQHQKTSFIHAAGEVLAKTKREIFAQVDLVEEKINYTGKIIKKTQVELFGVKIPLYFSQNIDFDNEIIENNNQLELLGLKLPFGIYIKEYREVKRENIILTKDEALKKARALIEEQKKELNFVKIERQTEEVISNNNNLKLILNLNCEENIAIEKKILFENN